MATPTSHETESMAPPTTAAKSQAKHPRGRGGRWADMLKGKPMPQPENKIKPTKSQAAPTLEQVRAAAGTRTARGWKVEEREVTLHGAHTEEDAVQRVSKGLTNAGSFQIKTIRRNGITMVRGRSMLMQRPDVTVRLDKVPEGHLATIISGQFTGGNPLRKQQKSVSAIEKAAFHIGQMSDIAPGAEPQLEMFKHGT